MKTAPMESLESRALLNAAFDLIGLTSLRNDPLFAGLDGSGVTVAVLDTGLDRRHASLSANYVAGVNIADGGADPVDRQGHGTHVSGIVGARDSQIGVATRAGLVGVKVLDDNGAGTMVDIRDGLRWVYDNRATYNIQVVNMSLGGGFYRSASAAGGDILLPEVRRLEAAGVTVVSAAGNSYKGNEFQNLAAPGVYSTLGVGAVWKDGVNVNVQWGSGAIDFTTGPGRITSFSQRLAASNIVFAPGALMRSTVPGNAFEQVGGTSQASPVVAGCVAIMQQAADRFGGRRLSPAEVRQIITSTAVSIFDGDDENDNVANTGVTYSRIDIHAAVREVRALLQGTAPPPNPGLATDANGTISGAFLVAPALDGSETRTLAGVIGTDGSAQTGATDVDMFRFTTASRGIVTITLSSNASSPADFDTFLRLFTTSGSLIRSDDDGGGGGFSLISVTLDPGTYCVGVSGFGNVSYDPASSAGRAAGATGSYVISFSLANSDPNGLFAGAVAVNFGTDLAPAFFPGFIGFDYGNRVGTSDVDMFKVVAPDGGTIVVDIDTPDASGYVDSFLRIFSDEGVELASSDDSLAPDEIRAGSLALDAASGAVVGHFTDSFKTLRVERGRTYYVAVSDYDNREYDPATLEGRITTGTGGTYQIRLAFRSVDADGAISLVRSSPALPLPFGPLVRNIGLDTGPDLLLADAGDKDVDFYRIRVAKASLLEIAVRTDLDSTFDTLLQLYDAEGRLLAFNDDFNGLDPTIQCLIQANTDYFVAVSAYGNADFDPFAAGSGTSAPTGAYAISGRLFATSSVRSVADDAVGFARMATLAPGASARGRLGDDGGFASGASDVDLFRVVAPSDGALTVHADGNEQFSADPVLRVFDSSGRELAFNDNRSGETRGATVGAQVKKGKTYYVGVSGAGEFSRAYDPRRFGSARPGSTGAYTLTSSFNLPPTLSAIATLATADAARPFTITHDMLAAAANEADPEGAPVSFAVSRVSGGTLAKDGAPIVAGVTTLSPGESLVWTPAARASGVVKAFTVVASDGLQRTITPVQVSVQVNQPPTLSRPRELVIASGATSLAMSHAALLAATGARDPNRDTVRFIVGGVLDGTLLLNNAPVVIGESRIGPGDTLLWQPSTPAAPRNTRTPAFSLLASDGRLASLAAATLTVRVG
jgi:subtilisin family serine protease